jgi:hypothetical protein
MSRNCNHFADAFCTQLVGKGIPAYVNRLAAIGTPSTRDSCVILWKRNIPGAERTTTLLC